MQFTIHNGKHLHVVDKKILSRIPYFHSIIDGQFMESGKEILEVDMNDEFLSLVFNEKVYPPKAHLIEFIDFLLFLGMNDTLGEYHKMIKNKNETPSPEIIQYALINNDLRRLHHLEYYLNYFNKMFLFSKSPYHDKYNEYPILTLYVSPFKSSLRFDHVEARKTFKVYFEDNLRENINNEQLVSDILKLIRYGDDDFISFFIDNVKTINDFIIKICTDNAHLMTINAAVRMYKMAPSISLFRRLLKLTFERGRDKNISDDLRLDYERMIEELDVIIIRY